MKVSLISFTPEARELLIFTKSTRLNMTPGLFDEIRAWPEARKHDELAYMSRTIPSSWEFVDYTFLVEGVSRAFTHQFVRSRIASFAQQTLRTVAMEDFNYTTGPSIANDKTLAMIYDRAMQIIQDCYNDLIADGAKTEDARGILPTNICTNIVAKFNLRALSELYKKRSSGRVQDEYRDVLNAMVDRVLEAHPWAELFIKPRQNSVVQRLREIALQLRRSVAIDPDNAGSMVTIANEVDKEADILLADLQG